MFKFKVRRGCTGVFGRELDTTLDVNVAVLGPPGPRERYDGRTVLHIDLRKVSPLPGENTKG